MQFHSARHASAVRPKATCPILETHQKFSLYGQISIRFPFECRTYAQCAVPNENCMQGIFELNFKQLNFLPFLSENNFYPQKGKNQKL